MNSIYVELGALGGLIIVLWWLFREMHRRINSLEKKLADTRENYAHKDSIVKIEEKIDNLNTNLTNHIMGLVQKIGELGGSIKSKGGK